jgi:hypothetical protein
MGVFKNMQKGYDNDFDSGENELEEQYQKMFKKIARDFATIEDLDNLVSRLNLLMTVIKRLNPEILDDLEGDIISERETAVLKAMEYKSNLEKPRSKRSKYKDVSDGR